MEHVSKFKYLECVLDDSGADEAECDRKVVVPSKHISSI